MLVFFRNITEGIREIIQANTRVCTTLKPIRSHTLGRLVASHEMLLKAPVLSYESIVMVYALLAILSWCIVKSNF